MRVKVIKPFSIGSKKHIPDELLDVEEWRGIRLIGEGHAVSVAAPAPVSPQVTEQVPTTVEPVTEKPKGPKTVKKSGRKKS